jgi:hypothetical protein
MTSHLTNGRQVIAVEDYLFTLLSDVFETTHDKLLEQAERRCARIVDAWVDNGASATRRRVKSGDLAWSAEKRDAHRCVCACVRVCVCVCVCVVDTCAPCKDAWRFRLGFPPKPTPSAIPMRLIPPCFNTAPG